MPAAVVCHKVRQLLSAHVGPEVRESTLDRLTLLVTGIIKGKSASPAAIAKAVHSLGLTGAKAESIERRVRRIENDDQVTAALCFHRLAKERLLLGRPSELLLIMDATTEEDDVVMLSASVWYRGRALPLAWTVWPANTPLEGDGFWARVAALLALVAELLPLHVQVTWVADRAFGTPAFTDLLRAWLALRRTCARSDALRGQARCGAPGAGSGACTRAATEAAGPGVQKAWLARS